MPPPSSRRFWAQQKAKRRSTTPKSESNYFWRDCGPACTRGDAHFLPANTSHNGNGVSCVFCPAAAGGMDTRQGARTTPPINHSRPPQKGRSRPLRLERSLSFSRPFIHGQSAERYRDCGRIQLILADSVGETERREPALNYLFPSISLFYSRLIAILREASCTPEVINHRDEFVECFLFELVH